MTDFDHLEELARWWWSLTDEERQAKRVEFLEKVRVDREFAADVTRLLAEEKPYMWSSVWDDA